MKGVELGLIIELHIGPDYGAQVADVLRDIPDSVVLIDHLAEPHKGILTLSSPTCSTWRCSTTST